MTHSEAKAECAKHKIGDYKRKGVNLQGVTFFPVKFEVLPHPDAKGTNYEVLVELEVLTGSNLHITLTEYFALLKY